MDGDKSLPTFAEIPDKKYFKIGEVADILGVKPYVLRYWESEFQALAPRKSSGSHRMYQRQDIELLLHIKRLLHEEMFTIAGARKRLHEMIQEGKLNIFDDEGASFLGDALEGVGQAVMEQEVVELRAAQGLIEHERDEAIETARLATDALREVENAHAETQRELDRTRKLLQDAELDLALAQDQLQRAREEALQEQERAEEAQLRLQAASAERDALIAQRQAAEVERADRDQIARAAEDAWLREAQQAALEETRRQQKELRARLHDQVFKTRQTLQTVRSELLGLKQRVE